jgi:hypothetical protein
MGQNPAATAAAEPDDEPPGFEDWMTPEHRLQNEGTYAMAAARVIIAKGPSYIWRLCLTTHSRPAAVGQIGPRSDQLESRE